MVPQTGLSEIHYLIPKIKKKHSLSSPLACYAHCITWCDSRRLFLQKLWSDSLFSRAPQHQQPSASVFPFTLPSPTHTQHKRLQICMTCIQGWFRIWMSVLWMKLWNLWYWPKSGKTYTELHDIIFRLCRVDIRAQPLVQQKNVLRLSWAGQYSDCPHVFLVLPETPCWFTLKQPHNTWQAQFSLIDLSPETSTWKMIWQCQILTKK